MKALAVVAFAMVSGCSSCSSPNYNADATIAPDGPPAFGACDADPGSFVKQAILAIDGRRAKSQAEVAVYTDLYNAVMAKGGDPKDAVARAMMAEPEFAERWISQTMDAMHVQRYDIQTEATCWQVPERTTVTPALAMGVRDQNARAAATSTAWNLADLAASAIALDDVTPLYRAQLFSMMNHPIPAANVFDGKARELAQRADFGSTFDSAYMHRDTVCLTCHNSQSSVTDNDDPAIDRFWPVPGLPEHHVYGSFNMVDAATAHTSFRVDSFVGFGNAKPWGWDGQSCGTFNANPVPVDPAAVSGLLASVTGTSTTAFDLEAALKHGFDQLRGNPPPDDDLYEIADPDMALAWIVTLKMTEDVWVEVVGTPLTIANYYPRNKAARDTLYTLAAKYTQSGYSLKTLLSAIVSSEYFNRKPAEDACGAGPYTYPNVYDPWVIADPDVEKRLNGPGDVVAAVDARTLVTALAGALEWTPPAGRTRFADYGESAIGDDTCEKTTTCAGLRSYCMSQHVCCDAVAAACDTDPKKNGPLPSDEVPFERGLGMFMRNSERGFRGLDFEARLVWEAHEAECTRPLWVTTDFIDTLVTEASASTKTSDLVAALKDRLIGEPAIDPGAETTALAAIVGPLDASATTVTATQLRQLCSVLVGSPQFLLSGIAGRGATTAPALTPPNARYDAVCARVAALLPGATCAPTLALP